MRHGRKVNKLSRKAPHRKAMFSNMAASLILHKRINTTMAKAKALRGYVEPLINRSKEDTTHSRRMVFNLLQSKEATRELFAEIGTKIASRPGGYTRILKIANRPGDNADMCMMELVDFNETYVKETKPARTTRRRRTRKGGAPGAAGEETVATKPRKESKPVPDVEEAPAENEVVDQVEEEPIDRVDQDNDSEAPKKDE